jgi:hypothetical protein
MATLKIFEVISDKFHYVVARLCLISASFTKQNKITPTKRLFVVQQSNSGLRRLIVEVPV